MMQRVNSRGQPGQQFPAGGTRNQHRIDEQCHGPNGCQPGERTKPDNRKQTQYCQAFFTKTTNDLEKKRKLRQGNYWGKWSRNSAGTSLSQSGMIFMVLLEFV